jgi:hypothetical protein
MMESEFCGACQKGYGRQTAMMFGLVKDGRFKRDTQRNLSRVTARRPARLDP